MSWIVRVLVRALPRAFREEFGEEVVAQARLSVVGAEVEAEVLLRMLPGIAAVDANTARLVAESAEVQIEGPAAGFVAGRRRTREASREHVPVGEHRPGQRDGTHV